MPFSVQDAHGQGHEKKLAFLLADSTLNGKVLKHLPYRGSVVLSHVPEPSSDDDFRHFRYFSRERRRCEITRADESGSSRWILYNDADLTKVQAGMLFTRSVVHRKS